MTEKPKWNMAGDNCRCVNDQCPMRESCLRWLTRGTGHERTPFAMFEPDENGNCRDMIRVEAGE